MMIFIALFPFVIIKLAKGTLVLRRVLQKFYNVDFISLSFFMTLMDFVKLVIDARG